MIKGNITSVYYLIPVTNTGHIAWHLVFNSDYKLCIYSKLEPKPSGRYERTPILCDAVEAC